jgi:hypothetical protein
MKKSETAKKIVIAPEKLEFFVIGNDQYSEVRGMIERKKVEPSEKERVLELLIEWEEKIAGCYTDCLWEDSLESTEKTFHLILEEWSSDTLRPVRRVIGSCKKQGNDELLEMTCESMALCLQKIRICCEDFTVYTQLKRVEDLSLTNLAIWTKNFVLWRKEIDQN